MAYAALATGKPYLSVTGALHWKIDNTQCFNAADGTIGTAPTEGYECDVQILARYTRKELGK